MKKYRTTHNSIEITAIEVEKETEKYVWIEKTRHLKISFNWNCYFNTEKEAIEFLITREKAAIQKIREQESNLLNKRIKLRDNVFFLENTTKVVEDES